MMRTSACATYLEVIMLSKELISKSVEELAPLIENKSFSTVELTKAVLDQAEATQETVNSYMEIYKDDTLIGRGKKKLRKKSIMENTGACTAAFRWQRKIIFISKIR